MFGLWAFLAYLYAYVFWSSIDALSTVFGEASGGGDDERGRPDEW